VAGRSRHESITIYIGALQRATSCVTPQVYTTPGAYQSRSGLVDVLLGSGEPVRLRGPGRIHLRVRLRARVTQADPPRGLWDAETAAYEYRISDQDDREILAYHWHPEGRSHVETPHLHLGPAAEVGRTALLTAHLPTGPVGLHEVLRLALESFEVAPIRSDWEPILGV
jgi:hypothetical protein